MMLIGLPCSVSWGKPGKSLPKKAHKTHNVPMTENSGETPPISVDADQLDVFENKQQAIFKGNVHVVQDGVHLRCSELTLIYEKASDNTLVAPGPSEGEHSFAEKVALKSLECKGPVNIISDDQEVRGEYASFDKVAQAIKVIGNAKLIKGTNILQGDRVLYRLSDRTARVEGRVKALFSPQENDLPQKSNGK
jgi:lipopolysaccharide export system protein LptA